MYLLDSSAWLAHLFGESGMAQVNQLFEDGSGVHISVLSIPEVYGRLTAMGRQQHWPEVWRTYRLIFMSVLPVAERVAHFAVSLRGETPKQLPTIDGLIAGTAAVHNLTLVHRDPHLTSIPANLLPQLQLPDK